MTQNRLDEAAPSLIHENMFWQLKVFLAANAALEISSQDRAQGRHKGEGSSCYGGPPCLRQQLPFAMLWGVNPGLEKEEVIG